MSQTFFCIPDVSLLITGLLSILKPDAMATKGYSFQDDEKTIIDVDIVVEKEKNVPVLIFFGKFEISKLVKCFRRWKVTNFFLFDETFNWRNILTDET